VSLAEARTEARALRRAVARLQRAFRTTREADCPSPGELSALGTLMREGVLSTGELAARECLKPQSVTRLLAALESRGLIERGVDAADRRRIVVRATAEGRRRVTREMQRRDAGLTRALAELQPAERATLQSACLLLERLTEATVKGE
jgi:DNA-binding MarR family transcriptional regulator